MFPHERAFLREAVPRARLQANVASVNAIPDRGPELLRNRSLQLDGQVGNAAPRIQSKWPGDRLRRASIDAARADAAAIFLRLIRRQLQRGDDLREEKPVPKRTADQVRVLARKTNSRALRQIPLQQRAGIHVPQALRFRTAKRV